MIRMGMRLATGVMLAAVVMPSLSGADENDGPKGQPPRRERGGEDRPPPPDGRRPPPPPPHPLELALDADGDGEISADEIAGAVEALKKADRNGDGKLAGSEIRPPHPPHGPPPGGRGEGPPPRGAGEGRGERRPMGPPPGEDGDDRPPPRRRGGPPRE